MYSADSEQDGSIIAVFFLKAKAPGSALCFLHSTTKAHIIEAQLFWWNGYCRNKGAHNLRFVRVL